LQFNRLASLDEGGRPGCPLKKIQGRPFGSRLKTTVRKGMIDGGGGREAGSTIEKLKEDNELLGGDPGGVKKGVF